MSQPIAFTTSDARLLLSIAIAAGGREAPLASVIAVGDGINRAIFTAKELRRGTANLVAGGLTRYEAGRYSLTEAGLGLCDSTTGPVLTRWRQLSELLGAAPGPADEARLEDGGDPFPELTDGAIESAVREYAGGGGKGDAEA